MWPQFHQVPKFKITEKRKKPILDLVIFVPPLLSMYPFTRLEQFLVVNWVPVQGSSPRGCCQHPDEFPHTEMGRDPIPFPRDVSVAWPWAIHHPICVTWLLFQWSDTLGTSWKLPHDTEVLVSLSQVTVHLNLSLLEQPPSWVPLHVPPSVQLPCLVVWLSGLRGWRLTLIYLTWFTELWNQIDCE